MTDAAIEAFRQKDAERFIVHYVQPHAPFLHCVGKYGSIGDGGHGGTQKVWNGLKEGEFDRSEVWGNFGENLLIVPDQVGIILRNVSGKVIVTADYGNAMGEWCLYGHLSHAPVPIIKRVPWAEPSSMVLTEYQVKGVEEISIGLGEHDLRDNLKALGYIERNSK